MAIIPEIMQEGWRHHQAGQWQEAEQHYRQVLEVEPDHIDAAYLCGAVCHVQGHLEEALALSARAATPARPRRSAQ